MNFVYLCLAIAFSFCHFKSAFSLGQPQCLTFTSSDTDFALVHAGFSAPILLNSSDNYAVHRAASDFIDDIERITGIRTKTYNDTLGSNSKTAVVVGTMGSKLVQQLIRSGKLQDANDFDGKWESFHVQVVDTPMEGLDEALVIVGSDKRGTIYGLYDLSEQMGVSPWYWWADVPTVHQDSIYSMSNRTCEHGEPTVKYRGFFFNDEQPGLANWAVNHYHTGSDPVFIDQFYAHAFELLLRLKANYLWPAMWFAMFDVDGLNVSNGLPQQPIAGPNQVLADMYGIVMGTSHEEPMARNTPEWTNYGNGDWNFTTNSAFLTAFWRYGAECPKPYDTLFTVGMRGDGDIPLPGADIQILENITASLRIILSDVFNTSDVTTIPQMWCMYKEVMTYYATGLQVPDDVTVLFSDDNWGNLMRVPEAWEQNRTGGAGIYYHADYVGSPRDYKWINTVSLPKTWEQMNLAVEHNATNIWILNVGDLKPLEVPTEFFLSGL